MDLSKGPVSCVARGVPMLFLDPAGHLHPAISSPLPPRGTNTWARCAGTWPLESSLENSPPRLLVHKSILRTVSVRGWECFWAVFPSGNRVVL